jgi:hypothetical protein
MGAIASVETMPAERGDAFDPNPAHHARYQAALARQRELYHLLVGTDTASGPPPVPGSMMLGGRDFGPPPERR